MSPFHRWAGMVEWLAAFVTPRAATYQTVLFNCHQSPSFVHTLPTNLAQCLDRQKQNEGTQSISKINKQLHSKVSKYGRSTKNDDENNRSHRPGESVLARTAHTFMNSFLGGWRRRPQHPQNLQLSRLFHC